MGELSHLDDQGAARMVDVSAKPETERVATAGCRVVLAPETLELLASAGLPKGDALAVARVAGIMGAKRTPDLIPLCHPLPITGVEVDLALEADAVRVTATVRTTGRTGVEMEALTAAATAALTLYDMVKGVQRDVRVEDLRLLAKRGGRSGDYVAPVSGSWTGCGWPCSPSATGWPPGPSDDAGGSALCELLEAAGAEPGLAGRGGRRARADRRRPAGHGRRRRRGPHHRRHRPRPPRRHPRGHPGRPRPRGPRHRRGPAPRQPGHHPVRHAVAGHRRPGRAGPGRQPPRQPQGRPRGVGGPRPRPRPRRRDRPRPRPRREPFRGAPEGVVERAILAVLRCPGPCRPA